MVVLRSFWKKIKSLLNRLWKKIKWAVNRLWSKIKWGVNRLWKMIKWLVDIIAKLFVGWPMCYFSITLEFVLCVLKDLQSELSEARSKLWCHGEMVKYFKMECNYVLNHKVKNEEKRLSGYILWPVYTVLLSMMGALRGVLSCMYKLFQLFAVKEATGTLEFNRDHISFIGSGDLVKMKGEMRFWYWCFLEDSLPYDKSRTIWALLENKSKKMQFLDYKWTRNINCDSPRGRAFIACRITHSINLMPLGLVLFLPWLIKIIVWWVACYMCQCVLYKFKLMALFIKFRSFKSPGYEKAKDELLSRRCMKICCLNGHHAKKYNIMAGIVLMIFAGPFHIHPLGLQIAGSSVFLTEVFGGSCFLGGVLPIIEFVSNFSTAGPVGTLIPEASQEASKMFMSQSPDNQFESWDSSKEPIMRRGDTIMYPVKDSNTVVSVNNPAVRSVWNEPGVDPYKTIWESRAKGLSPPDDKIITLSPDSSSYNSVKNLIESEMDKNFPGWKENGLSGYKELPRLYFFGAEEGLNFKIEVGNLGVWGEKMKIEVERPSGFAFKPHVDSVNMVSNSIKTGKFLPAFQSNVSAETQSYIFSNLKLEPVTWSSLFEGKFEWSMKDMEFYPNTNPEWQRDHDSMLVELLENEMKKSCEKNSFVCSGFDYMKNSVIYTSKGRTEEDMNNEIIMIKEFFSSYENTFGSSDVLAESVKLNNRALELQKENLILAKKHVSSELKKAETSSKLGDLLVQTSYMNQGAEMMINSREGTNSLLEGLCQEKNITQNEISSLEKNCKEQLEINKTARLEGKQLDLHIEKAVVEYTRHLEENSSVSNEFDKFRLRLKDMCSSHGLTKESLQGLIKSGKNMEVSKSVEEPSTSREGMPLEASGGHKINSQSVSVGTITDSMWAKANEWDFEFTESNLGSSAMGSSDPSAAVMADNESSDSSSAFLSFNDKSYSVKPHLVEYSSMSSSSDNSGLVRCSSPKMPSVGMDASQSLSTISENSVFEDSVEKQESDSEFNSTGPYQKHSASSKLLAKESDNCSDPDSLSTVPSGLNEHPDCDKEGIYKFYSSDSQSNKNPSSQNAEFYSSSSQSGKTPSTSSPRSSGNETLNDPGVSVINQDSLSFEEASSSLSSPGKGSQESPTGAVGFSSFDSSLLNEGDSTSVGVDLDGSTSSNIDEVASFSKKFVNKYQGVKKFNPTGKGQFETSSSNPTPDKFVNPFKSKESLEGGKYFSEAKK
nr:hypothetical protein [Donax semistriatus]